MMYYLIMSSVELPSFGKKISRPFVLILHVSDIFVTLVIFRSGFTEDCVSFIIVLCPFLAIAYFCIDHRFAKRTQSFFDHEQSGNT